MAVIQKYIFCCSVFVLCLYAPALAQENPGAREVFAQLPLTIFENTPEGLTEADKQDLLETGKSEFWELAGETGDVMVFVPLPFRERAIGLRIFPNAEDGSVEVAIGTLEDPVCSLELWRLDKAGRLIPIDTPAEPDIKEFFDKGHKLSKRVHHSVLICLGAGGLKASPIFWNDKGMLLSKVDNEISYQWNGREFIKTSRPRGFVQPRPSK